MKIELCPKGGDANDCSFSFASESSMPLDNVLKDGNITYHAIIMQLDDCKALEHPQYMTHMQSTTGVTDQSDHLCQRFSTYSSSNSSYLHRNRS